MRRLPWPTRGVSVEQDVGAEARVPDAVLGDEQMVAGAVHALEEEPGVAPVVFIAERVDLLVELAGRPHVVAREAFEVRAQRRAAARISSAWRLHRASPRSR